MIIDYIEVDLDLDELDITSAESKATYAEIKDYRHPARAGCIHTKERSNNVY